MPKLIPLVANTIVLH